MSLQKIFVPLFPIIRKFLQPTAAVIFSLLDMMRTRQVVEPINVLTSPLVDLINFRTPLIKHNVERTKKN